MGVESYPEYSWSLFSVTGQKNNEKFKKDLLHKYNLITKSFIKSPEEFKEDMKELHNVLDSYGRYVYENFFYDLLYSHNFFENMEQKDLDRVLENTMTLLFYYCKGCYQKDFSRLNIHNVDVTILRMLRDIVETKIDVNNPCDWVWVEVYLCNVCHECMKESFHHLDYNQIDAIMHNFSGREYAKYLIDYVKHPVISYSENNVNHRISEAVPVIWAMGLSNEMKRDSDFQTPFKYEHTSNKWKFYNIIDFFTCIKEYEEDMITSLDKLSSKTFLHDCLTESFYSNLLLQISLNENENQKTTLEMLYKGFGDDFLKTNNITLSEYYDKMYLDTGTPEYKIKGKILAEKEEELNQTRPEM